MPSQRAFALAQPKLKNREVLVLSPSNGPFKLMAAYEQCEAAYVTFITANGKIAGAFSWTNITGYAWPDVAEPKGVAQES